MTSMEYLVPLLGLLLGVTNIQGRAYLVNDNYHASSAPIGHDGRVVDTPEVAAAKAAHLAAFSKLASGASPYNDQPRSGHAPAAAPYYGGYSNPSFFSSRIEHGPYGYQGPPAPLANDGRVVDTPEVAQAKAAHFAAYNQAATRSYNDGPASYSSGSAEDYSGDYQPTVHRGEPSYQVNDDDEGSSSAEGYDNSGAYQGPAAPLDDDGRVVDTPEVAQAKAAHLAAVHRASASSHAPRYYKKHRPRIYKGY